MKHTDPMIVCDQCLQMRRWFPQLNTSDFTYVHVQNGFYEFRFNRGMPCKSLIIKHKRLYK